MPERYGPGRTVASRFYRWQRAGVFDRVLADLQRAVKEAPTPSKYLHLIQAHQLARDTRTVEIRKVTTGTGI